MADDTDSKDPESSSRYTEKQPAFDTTLSSNDVFHDRTISVKDWSARTFTNPVTQIKDYFVSLFPIATWIYRYNFTWFIGDV